MVTVYSLVLICVINGFSHLVKGEDTIRKVIEKCCQIGRNSAVDSKCESHAPLGIEPDHQSVCLSVMELCCADVRRENECSTGIINAKSDGACLLEKSMDESRCCQACKLGLLSSVLEQTCDLGTSFGRLWDSAYVKCCDGTQEYNKKENNGDGEHGKNMCLMLPNELCHHNCVPSGQSYRCTCRPGWTLMSDGKSCTPVERKCIGCSGPDCIETGTGNMVCINCPANYHLDINNITCVEDVVETQTSVHCPVGYEVNEYSTEEVPICQDIDECLIDTICNLNEICSNTIGSYQCTSKTAAVICGHGYTFSPELRSCIDINECADTYDPPCDRNQNCVNTNGSFECKCKTGFKQDAITHACIDINECQQLTHNCVEYQRCDNTIGSYVCVRDVNCGTGYTLNSQSGKCEDDNECLLGTHTCNHLGHGYECKNTHGSFRCVKKTECTNSICDRITHHCPAGYRVSGKTCVDIDECLEGTARCGPNQRCVNIRGNYLCSNILSCKTGLKLNAEKTQCIDINECAEQKGICSDFCENRYGTFRCRCRPGYKLSNDNRTCVDINECDHDSLRCQGYCINQPGSYTCSCPPGYRSTGYLCEDINECEGSHKVCTEEEICINIAGNYRCNQINCPPGYRKDRELRNRCQKEDATCFVDDMECRRQPTAYSYNYISMVSNHTVPRNGGIKLFTIYSRLSSTATDFTYELVQARAPAGVKAATRNDFYLKKEYGGAIMELVKTLIGPQEIELEIKTEFFNGGTIIGTQISKLEIYVSMYSF